MAVISLVCTIGASGANGVPLSPYVQPSATQGSLPDTTDVTTAVGVLVADGIAPTQAHVTDLDAAWTIYLAAIAAYSASGVSGNVTMSFDTAVVTDKNKLITALRALMHTVDGGAGGLS